MLERCLRVPKTRRKRRLLWGALALAAAAGLLPAGQTGAAQQRAAILSTLYVPDPLPELQPRTHGRFEPCSGVTAERITFGTQFGMRIPAILYLPQRVEGKIPALIVVNGHGGDKFSWYAAYTGMLYAQGGAAVLTYDPVGEGERNSLRRSGTRAHDRIQGPPELARRLAGLMITDLRQAVSYLSQRPEVDRSRIAAAGYSMGSFVLGVAGAVETRLRACVLVGGGNLDGPGQYWDGSKPMCQGIPYQSLQFLGDRPAVLYALHAERGPTLIYNGLQDTTVRIPSEAERFFGDLRRRTSELRGGEAGVFDFELLDGAAHRPFFVTRPVALWLERHLNFPLWSEADIRNLPETHISEWASTHGVEMDPLYATEEREGGTRALGSGLPGLTRDQLTVLSDQEWAREKRQLILEGWLEQLEQLGSIHPAGQEER